VRIIDHDLSLKKRQFRRGHVIVMALAASATLIAATVPFGASSGAQDTGLEALAAQVARDRAAARVCRMRSIVVDNACAALDPVAATGDAEF
jgi:hypothetical protein